MAPASDFQMQDMTGDVDSDGSNLSFSGLITMYAKVVDKSGNQLPIVYSANVNATAELVWETDEVPTGWNYKNDSITYSKGDFATAGDIQLQGISFSKDFITLGDDEISAEEMHKILDPLTIKGLLDPSVFADVLKPYFDSKAEELDNN